MNENLPRIPPNDIQAEQMILGCMLNDQTKESINVAAEKLQPADFYNAAHREIFSAMIDIINGDGILEAGTLSTRLSETGKLDAAGGYQYLAELMAGAWSSYAIKDYVKTVKEKAERRRIIESAERQKEAAFDPDTPVWHILEDSEKDIASIQQSQDTEGPVFLKDVMTRAMEEFEERLSNKGEVVGIPSGFTDLDKKTAGFQKSDLVIIGARPSMGKTAFALNIAQHAARRGKICAFFSLEMATIPLVFRLLSCDANVEAEKIRTGQYLSEYDLNKIGSSWNSLWGSTIAIDDTPGLTVREIRSRCRKLKKERGLDMIIIDYLQLITGRNAESRQVEISEISRGLKAVAREMECPVIALSQLGRALEQRGDHRPMLSDLRESGAIEQDADLVIFLYRDEYYHRESKDQGIAEVIVAKQRNGSTGTVKLAFLADYTKFANLQL